MKLPALILIFFFYSSNAVAESSPSEDKQAPIKFGFFPIISTVALYKRFSRLRDYLSAELGRKVLLLTAKDFPTFVKRTNNREYDIVVTAPHFAVSAADTGLYRIRATLTNDVQQLIVVKTDSSYTSIDQLAGKNISTPPTRALMTMMGKRYLNEFGLIGDKAPMYHAFTSHNAANQALIGGEVDAAITSSNIIKKALQGGEPLKIISHGLKIPNMATLVATDQNELIGEQLVQILVNMKNTERGRNVLASIKFRGYRAVNDKDYEVARHYMEQAREMSN